MNFKAIIPISLLLLTIPIAILSLSLGYPGAVDSLLVFIMFFFVAVGLSQLWLSENSYLDEFTSLAFSMVVQTPFWVITALIVEAIFSSETSSEGVFIRLASCTFYLYSSIVLSVKINSCYYDFKRSCQSIIDKNHFKIRVNIESEVRQEVESEYKKEVDTLKLKIDSLTEINEFYKNSLEQVSLFPVGQERKNNEPVNITKKTASFD